MVAIAAATALVVGVAAILSFALQGTLPVTNDPAPASNVSAAQTFAPTKGLISDPFVLPTSRLDYMYSSGVAGVGEPHLPERTFTVMGTFLSLRDAMPRLPAWVEPNSELWSPDVRKVGKTYVMWFSGLDRGYMLSTGAAAQCIGVATSTSPTGPFVSHSPTPTICQISGHGDIDPRTFVAPNGQEWLYWKNDGNAVGMGVGHYPHLRPAAGNQRADADWLNLGAPHERPPVGGGLDRGSRHGPRRQSLPPVLLRQLHLGDDSGIGLALCKGPGGPCTSPYSGPWLGSNVQGAGPDEETVYTQNGITWMLYTPHALYYTLALPRLVAARIAFTPTGMPYIANRQGMVPGVTAGRDGQVGLR